MEILSNENFSRIKFVRDKYNYWLGALESNGMMPVRVYLSHNWYVEMIEEVAEKCKTGIFTEYVFQDNNGCRVYLGLPLVIVKDSNYFALEGTVCKNLTSNVIKTTVMPLKQLPSMLSSPSTR